MLRNQANFLNRRIHFNQKGSLLVEVLLAIVILSTVLTVIIQAMISSLRANDYASGYTKAGFLLENKMFDLIRKGTISSGASDEGSFPEPDNQYRYAFKVSSPDEQANDIFRVELKVNWESGKKKNSLALETYLPGEKK